MVYLKNFIILGFLLVIVLLFYNMYYWKQDAITLYDYSFSLEKTIDEANSNLKSLKGTEVYIPLTPHLNKF